MTKHEKNMIIVSGIGPGPSGTGRVVAHLARNNTDLGVRLVVGPSRFTSLRAAIRSGRVRDLSAAMADRLAGRLRPRVAYWSGQLRRANTLVVMHPQTLGYGFVARIVDSRAFTWFYVMDASVFCVRSYNYLPNATEPCFKCLSGPAAEAAANGCLDSVSDGAGAAHFISHLRGAASRGAVGFFAQNDLQVRLLRENFGADTPVHLVGLWASDWDRALDSTSRSSAFDSSAPVVFHGSEHPAKGSHWAFQVAGHCPKISFLFPFARPLSITTPPNCIFRPMTWETGLEAAVRAAPLVLVPSLWSAPVEGALIKSIAAGRAVAVVDNESAFSHELPMGLVSRLPPDPLTAAAEIRGLVASGVDSDGNVRRRWLEDFALSNRPTLENVARCLR